MSLNYLLVHPGIYLNPASLCEGWGLGWDCMGQGKRGGLWTLTAGMWDMRGLCGQEASDTAEPWLSPADAECSAGAHSSHLQFPLVLLLSS